MENVWWEYDKLPHMLIAGGTGGGKTYFILTLIEALLRTNAILFVLDPKNADLADLQAVMPDVYYKKEDIGGIYVTAVKQHYHFHLSDWKSNRGINRIILSAFTR